MVEGGCILLVEKIFWKMKIVGNFLSNILKNIKYVFTPLSLKFEVYLYACTNCKIPMPLILIMLLIEKSAFFQLKPCWSWVLHLGQVRLNKVDSWHHWVCHMTFSGNSFLSVNQKLVLWWKHCGISHFLFSRAMT